MKLNRIDRELVGNYIEEYVDELEYHINNLGELYKIYVMDEDSEVSHIEKTLEMMRCKISKIKKAQAKDDLKEVLNLKKVTETALDKGGTYGRWD